jgi:hypothetical protein
MNERQEAQWLYAQGLELAILLKGPPSSTGELKMGWEIDDYLFKPYHELAIKIAMKIVNFSAELIPKDLK